MFFFFFKKKTAYEMRISDWSSDVCSSDLLFDLRERLESDRDAATKLAKPRLRILQPLDPAQRVQLVNMEPDARIERRLERQGFKDCNIHPPGDEAAQRSRLIGGIGHPERTAFPAHPAPDRKWFTLDARNQLQKIGRASCREECVVRVDLGGSRIIQKKKKNTQK